jgi:phage-related protein (TIGR01555 family)
MTDTMDAKSVSNLRMSMDTWQSLLTGVGTNARDKRLSRTFERSTTLSYMTMENLFHDDDIANRIARLPAMDRWREWVDYTTDEVEDTVWIQQKHQELHSITRLTEAGVWANVFGGAILYVGAVDGRSAEEPLDMGRIKSVDFLSVWDRRDLHIYSINADMLSPNFGEPELYQLRPVGGLRVPLQGTPILIHHSRVIRFDGALTTRRRKARNLGWSDSIYQRVFERLRGYNASWDAVEVLLEDFSQAVFKIGGLREMLCSADGATQLQARMEAADMARSVLRAMLLDAENEEFERKPTPMTDLPAVIELFMLRIAAAAEMPVTLLFGRSPAGLNATGDNDLRQYYDRIRAEQNAIGRPQLEKLSQILWASRSKGEPENWSFKFKPLRQLSDDQIAQIHQTQAQADQLYWTMGYPANKIFESRFTAEGYSLQTQPLEPRLIEDTREGVEGTEETEGVEGTEEARGAEAVKEGTEEQSTTKSDSDIGHEDENIQQQVLNGIQIQSMQGVVQAVARGELPRASGVAILETGFFLDAPTAERIMGDAGQTFFAASPTTAVKASDDDNLDDKDKDNPKKDDDK